MRTVVSLRYRTAFSLTLSVDEFEPLRPRRRSGVREVGMVESASHARERTRFESGCGWRQVGGGKETRLWFHRLELVASAPFCKGAVRTTNCKSVSWPQLESSGPVVLGGGLGYERGLDLCVCRLEMDARSFAQLTSSRLQVLSSKMRLYVVVGWVLDRCPRGFIAGGWNVKRT